MDASCLMVMDGIGYNQCRCRPKAVINTENETKLNALGFVVQHGSNVPQQAIKKWPFGFVYGVYLDLRQTEIMIKTKRDNMRNTCKFGATR